MGMREEAIAAAVKALREAGCDGVAKSVELEHTEDVYCASSAYYAELANVTNIATNAMLVVIDNWPNKGVVK